MLAAEVVATRPVTLADIPDGHKVLDVSCLDRIYLNWWVPGLMTSGQLVGFLAHRGFPIPRRRRWTGTGTRSARRSRATRR
jgi:hypothetical protein